MSSVVLQHLYGIHCYCNFSGCRWKKAPCRRNIKDSKDAHSSVPWSSSIRPKEPNIKPIVLNVNFVIIHQLLFRPNQQHVVSSIVAIGSGIRGKPHFGEPYALNHHYCIGIQVDDICRLWSKFKWHSTFEEMLKCVVG